MYPDALVAYNEYVSEIEKCRWDGVFTFKIQTNKTKIYDKGRKSND